MAIFGMGVGRCGPPVEPPEIRRSAGCTRGGWDERFCPNGTPDPITEAPSRRGILAAMLAEPSPLCSRRTLPAEALAVLAEGCGFLPLGVLAAPIALPIENVARRDALVPGLAR
ncbi:hypothetical protein [Variovorax guangxiensis]|uniref:hypothetical protein n=1 Tax=Variovorax guangxiensis TaxID=1775474 RepID=UPI00285DDC8E|nr:hypothetical protein [Variovorax guangxiensis]MDR6856036.1 hypothetical protein [Variovorax guangxiensis]